ncbi:hypothetical protein BT69DRAFT_1335555 [Atractiella rhizophila]|nr:hypothetical protein BT69DRAFT_1335555 [Atractiella rhizophila]
MKTLLALILPVLQRVNSLPQHAKPEQRVFGAVDTVRQPSKFSTEALLPNVNEYLFELCGNQYFSPIGDRGTLKVKVEGLDETAEFAPATVISVNNASVTARYLDAVLADFAQVDDVYCPSFSKRLFLQSSRPCRLEDDTIALLSQSVSEIVLLSAEIEVPASEALPVGLSVHRAEGAHLPAQLSGPFLAGTKGGEIFLHPVYRLYEDKYRTFVYGSYQLPFSSIHRPFLHNTIYQTNLIPVPSRLYSVHSEKPLAGVRIGVKDIYDVEGLVTAVSNRAWGEMTGVAKMSAISVQKLEDAGALVIGKTKACLTSQFAMGAAENAIEFHYPFQPRGDVVLVHHRVCFRSVLQLSESLSMQWPSGSACALAAYEWLDITLGTDTGGSIRSPASLSGLYGGRASHGSLSLDGVVPLVGAFDTLGFFARDPTAWRDFAEVMYSNSPLPLVRNAAFPRKILSTFERNESSAAWPIVNVFLNRLEEEYGMQTEYYNITQDLMTGEHSLLNKSSILSLRRETDFWTYVTWKENGQRLTDWHRARSDGRWPILDPQSRDAWTAGQELAESGNFTSHDQEDVAEKLGIGSLSLDGVVPLVGAFDTLGFFARDPTAWRDFAEVMYSNSPLPLVRNAAFPRKILSTFERNESSPAWQIVNVFLNRLEEVYGMQTEYYNITQDLMTGEHSLLNKSSILSLRRETDFWTYVTWKENGQRLTEWHRARSDGRWPILDPQSRDAWTAGQELAESGNFTSHDQEDVAEKLGILARLLDERLWGSNLTDNDCSDRIMVYDIGTGGLPHYREGKLNEADTKYKESLNNNRIATSMGSLAGVPDFTVPIGQVKYDSVVSKHEEYVPVTINFVARRGCDFMLWNLFEDMYRRGLLQKVQTGA